MVRDRYLRIIFIPILGLGIPYVSGVITYSAYRIMDLILAHAFFFLTSYLIWTGCSWVHKKLRPLLSTIANPATGMLLVLLVSGIYSACTGGFMVLLWYQLSSEVFSIKAVFIFMGCCALPVIFFAPFYEIIFLGMERKKDSSLVKQMGHELTQAELQALNVETDHHFIFNSLNAMNHLILEDPAQARVFNTSLSEVYKYFLLNKKKDLISLSEEVLFMKSYFFLLRIRYGNMIRLCISIDELQQLMIPPCALQMLIENAIKHNDFSPENPLQILVEKKGNYLSVSNNIHTKRYANHSTNIGLKNLNLRFQLTCKKEIIIEKTDAVYIVKLPLIEQTKIYSHD